MQGSIVLDRTLEHFAFLAGKACGAPIVEIRRGDARGEWHEPSLAPLARLISEGSAFHDRVLREGAFVTASPSSPAGIRFFAGTPLWSPEREPVGSLCVMDIRERPGPRPESEVLSVLANLIMGHPTDRSFRSALLETRSRSRNPTMPQNMGRYLAAIFRGQAVIGETRGGGPFMHISPNVVELLGFQPDQVRGRAILDWVHPEDAPRLSSLLRSSMTQGPESKAVCRLPRKDGTWRWFEAKCSYHRLVNGESRVIWTFYDVHDWKRVEGLLRHSQKTIVVGRAAIGLVHDMNNLLSVIQGFADLVLQRPDTADDMREDVLEIRRAASRASEMTRQLLALSRRDQNPAEPLNLNDVIEEMLKVLKHLSGKRIELQLFLGSGLQKTQAVRGQVEQILMNLVVNARDAMPQGGRIMLTTTLVEGPSKNPMMVGALGSGPYVCVSVEDTGSGMSEEVRSRLFQPFFTTKEQGSGTGLGLSIVQGLVEEMGGAIDVSTTLGKGTAFMIYFPTRPVKGRDS